MYSKIEKLASAVYNNINSGLQGFSTNDSLSKELIEDSIVLERLQILKEYSLKGILPYNDLYISINCIPVDCKNLERCNTSSYSTPTAHFEIPLILADYGAQAIEYIGTDDRQSSFLYYTSSTAYSQAKYRKRGKNKPYVWIDCTPNSNGMYDCFIFNCPLIKQVSISAIFKDLRQLDAYSCCTSDDNFSFIDNEIVKRLSEKLIRYYSIGALRTGPNNQQYNPG